MNNGFHISSKTPQISKQKKKQKSKLKEKQKESKNGGKKWGRRRKWQLRSAAAIKSITMAAGPFG